MLKNVNEKGKKIDMICFLLDKENEKSLYLDTVQEIFMKIMLNLNELLIKFEMDSFHRKIQDYFMILLIVYCKIMLISMLLLLLQQ